MSEFTLIFNTTTRQYEIWHHETIIHTYDYTEHKTTKRHHIQLADPDLYKAANYLASDLFRHNSTMTTRIWSAAEIVMKGGVRPPYYLVDSLNTYRVKDLAPGPPRSKTFHYPVTKGPNFYGCTCFDFTHNESCPSSNGQKMCEHVIAVKLQKMIQRPMQPWSIPQHATPAQVKSIMEDEAYQNKFGIPADLIHKFEAIRQANAATAKERPNPQLQATLLKMAENCRRQNGDRPQHMTDLTPTELDKLLYAEVLTA